MPDDIRRDYDEASAILELSPRGAATLIRLGIQKPCKDLGQPGENINKDIGARVAGGLDARLQQTLDAVRVIGNNAVHPGQIEIRVNKIQELKDRKGETVSCLSWGSFITGMSLVVGMLCLRETKDVDQDKN
ncbi:DUF4145 domain-containing protein [Pseudomonas sp. SWRI79]|uniref:DUF4145 domain-containing protein n=1 Tax=Pseudomonas farris TaxID=2841207 RepID=A0ABS6PZK7_9PSED|nr:DUF4145 domain-containing protein [Pseudomonas farris]MBV4465809.1 DUF4145 domain-containing protein [Pseudomonas farris]